MNSTRQQFNIIPAFRLLLLLFLFCPGFRAAAQEYKVVQDLHLWSGIKVEKRFNSDWSLFLAEEIRLKHDISEINNHLTETGLRYRINKNFALEGQYRITWDKKKDESYETLTRYAFDLRYRGKLDCITLYYRLRYQKEVEGWNLLDPSIPYEKYLRNRITFRYNRFNKIKPYVSAEVFQLFKPKNNARHEYMRVIGGVKYIHPRAGEINLAYGFNREIDALQPAMIYLLKLSYTYSF
ncbi:MAG: DUF2490 domain-containing protein [Bacteroidetes bacterium]|nr:DUF2490 domain-containing protein [Bacteroidota bacterium]